MNSGKVLVRVAPVNTVPSFDENHSAQRSRGGIGDVVGQDRDPCPWRYLTGDNRRENERRYAVSEEYATRVAHEYARRRKIPEEKADARRRQQRDDKNDVSVAARHRQDDDRAKAGEESGSDRHSIDAVDEVEQVDHPYRN